MATLLHELLEITSDLEKKRNRICGCGGLAMRFTDLPAQQWILMF